MAASTPHKKRFTTALAGPATASVSSEPAEAPTDLPAGLYEHLITDLLEQRIKTLPPEHFYIQQHPVDPAEAARYLTGHLSRLIRFALNEIPASQRPIGQIDLANKIIRFIAAEIGTLDLHHDLVATSGELLEAIINRMDHPHADLRARVREIMPHTRLTQSELFTGNRAGVSLESELKKEIASADEICWLVSFIKFSGIRTLLPGLRAYTQHRRFRILTTTYMGATDAKAIRELAALPNTEIKVSYDAGHERLHAKAYLFLRNSGFHTGYIGSSNLSRSALTNGLEWNMKVTTREVAHIIDKFRKTFDTYWQDSEFEPYEPDRDADRLEHALRRQRMRPATGTPYATGPFPSIHETDPAGTPSAFFFELTPKPFQREILERLHTERTLHQRRRNLLVAATGTGKTVVSAFDFKRFRARQPEARLLFIAHRKEILQQARATFRHVLRDANFGELWVDGYAPARFDTLFASVQTFNSQLDRLAALSPDYYHFIIIDEVHHLTASSYRTVLRRFEGQVLLGLTATPERQDGGDITEDFGGRIAAEIRLPEALNRKLLCPFQYFGVTDQTDLRQVNWRNGAYDAGELTRIYTGEHIAARQRVQAIIDALHRYCTDPAAVRALGFCVTKDHARYMAEAFQNAGLRAEVLIGETPREQREALRVRLQRGQLNYLFVVDVFNEGVDIPEVDTVLFLRPTESLTIFLQQLGRGLRLVDDKEILTVLDFVGNNRSEYDFAHKFRALIGRTRQSVQKEIEQDFPHLPLGCSVLLESQARQEILDNIRRATTLRRPQMLQRIRQFGHESTKPLSFGNFLAFNQLEPAALYKYTIGGQPIGWNRLCAEAGVRPDFTEPHEKELTRCIATRLLTTRSERYFRFILELMDAGCDLDGLIARGPDAVRQLGLMLHYDLWQTDGPSSGAANLRESLLRLQQNPVLLSEMRDVVEYLLNELDVIEKPLASYAAFPLHVHGRYNRDQILVAMQLHTWDRASSNREGVAENRALGAESLFVTLNKNEDEYSASTMYEDYAVSEQLFHWQTQNASVPEKGRGLSYIQHEQDGKRILLFVREYKKDHHGLTMSYVFLGECAYQHHSGARPMNIQWSLNEPIPPYLLNESQKLAAG